MDSSEYTKELEGRLQEALQEIQDLRAGTNNAIKMGQGEMMEESCKNCKFWEKQTVILGFCQRFPPTVVLDRYEVGDVREASSYSESELRTVWPETQDNDWCGEFKERSDGV